MFSLLDYPMFYITSTINTKSLVKISVVIKINTVSLYRVWTINIYRDNKISRLEYKNSY